MPEAISSCSDSMLCLLDNSQPSTPLPKGCDYFGNTFEISMALTMI